jgi:ABC-type Zn uptake system ZnuABC Zn-binding protein ZnuA
VTRRCLRAALIGVSLALQGAAAAAPLPVVTTIYPLELLVEELGGERVTVDCLVPPGANGHAFEPLPGDVARLARARLFVRVGAGLDDWIATLAPASVESVRVAEIEGVAPISSGAAGPDPHVWLDPVRVRDAVAPELARRLSGLDPDGRAHYQARLADLARRLDALDGEIRSILATAPGRRYVAFHAAWRYFGARYGLEEIGVVQEQAGEEPTPRELAALVSRARAARIPAILVEPQLDPRVARTLAAEFGAATVTVDPLGDPRDPERASYAGLLRYNARAFARALGGEAP